MSLPNFAACTSVANAFAVAAHHWPEQPFLKVLPETASCYGITATTFTYRHLLDLLTPLRARYQQAGYGHGHRVGLMCDNRPSFICHWLALNGLGVSVVPLSADLRVTELSYLIGHSEISLLVAPPVHHPRLQETLRKLASTLPLCTDAIDDNKTMPSAPRPSTHRQTPSVDDECAILYTSGTTGQPKGCLLSNRYFLYCGVWYNALPGLVQLRPGAECLLSPLPLTHMNAMACSLMAMVFCGGCLCLLDRFHPATWWHSVRQARATIIHYLGVMPAILMAAKASHSDDGDHQVRFGFGAGVDKTLHAAFEARFGFPLLEAWAMTETGSGGAIIACTEPRQVGSNCFGTVPPDIDIQLVDDTGQPVATNTPGELSLRRRGADPRFGFFSGYLKDPEATAAAWQNGWFHTGDIVYQDPWGGLHFVDRRKNVIRRSGENISALEVEQVIAAMPGITSVAVAAVADAVRGDEVLACVVPVDTSGDQAAFAEAIVHFVLSRLAYYKAPGYVTFVAELPLTASQKIQRAALKTLAQRSLAQGHCFDLRALKKRSA